MHRQLLQQALNNKVVLAVGTYRCLSDNLTRLVTASSGRGLSMSFWSSRKTMATKRTDSSHWPDSSLTSSACLHPTTRATHRFEERKEDSTSCYSHGCLGDIPIRSRPQRTLRANGRMSAPRITWQQYATFATDSHAGGGEGGLGDDDGDEDAEERRHCWRCNKLLVLELPNPESGGDNGGGDEDGRVCQQCGSLQPIPASVDFYALFGLKAREAYGLNLGELRIKYLALQQAWHPDRNINRSNNEADNLVGDNSTIINAAYRTLRNPYERALYLLKKRYKLRIDEDNIETEPELLLEIMELNEDIELAASDDKHRRAALMALEQRLVAEAAELEHELVQAFDIENDGARARALTIRMSYKRRALARVKEFVVDGK